MTTLDFRDAISVKELDNRWKADNSRSSNASRRYRVPADFDEDWKALYLLAKAA